MRGPTMPRMPAVLPVTPLPATAGNSRAEQREHSSWQSLRQRWSQEGGWEKNLGGNFQACQAQAEAQVTTEARDLGHYRSLFSGFVSPHLLPTWS